MKKRIAVALVALVMIFGCVVGGTLAWLTDTTTEVKNTFTYGDINIYLQEQELDDNGLTISEENTLHTTQNNQAVNITGFKMIPGNVIDKNPEVVVEEDSEACWLFIQVTKSSNFDTFLAYQMDTMWTPYDANSDGIADDGIYYYNGDALNSMLTADVTINLLGAGSYTDNAGTVTWGVAEVGVKPAVTKKDFEDNKDTLPTLTFNAYAVQKDTAETGINTVAEAYAIAFNN